MTGSKACFGGRFVNKTHYRKGRDQMMEENTENLEEREFYTLVDDEGVETEFELIGKTVLKGISYYAMIPAEEQPGEDEEFCEYVILRGDKDEDGEEMLVTIEDDEEFDDVADVFDDMFSEEVDYDGENK